MVPMREDKARAVPARLFMHAMIRLAASFYSRVLSGLFIRVIYSDHTSVKQCMCKGILTRRDKLCTMIIEIGERDLPCAPDGGGKEVKERKQQ